MFIMTAHTCSTHQAELEVSRGVPDVHGHLLVVQGGLVAVDLGHLGGVVDDEPSGAVADDQGCRRGREISCGVPVL